MKFSVATVAALLLVNPSMAFVPTSPMQSQQRTTSARFMALEMPPQEPATSITQTTETPTVKTSSMGQPGAVRYSDFLKLVNDNKIEKVTFSADGSQLLGVDVDGSRLKIDTLPNDPDLLTQLTSHKVCILHARKAETPKSLHLRSTSNPITSCLLYRLT